MADVTRILGDLAISIEAMIQREPPSPEHSATIIMLTHGTREANMNAAIERIEGLDAISGGVTRLRVEHLNAR